MPGRGPLYSPGRQNAASGDLRSMTSSQSTPAPAWLRPLVDYGPLAAFFAVYWLSGLTAATVALMAATALALVLALIFELRIPPMPLVTAAIGGVFGSPTLGLNDDKLGKAGW